MSQAARASDCSGRGNPYKFLAKTRGNKRAPSAVDVRRGLRASGGLRHRDPTMGARMLTTVLIVLLILLLLGVIPHRRWGWGYGPSHVLGIVLIVLLILVLAGRV